MLYGYTTIDCICLKDERMLLAADETMTYNVHDGMETWSVVMCTSSMDVRILSVMRKLTFLLVERSRTSNDSFNEMCLAFVGHTDDGDDIG
jgi:hypothetical protein